MQSIHCIFMMNYAVYRLHPSILAFTFVLGVLHNTKLWFCLKLFMLVTVIVIVSFLQMVIKGFETSKFVVIKFQHINISFKQQM